VVTPPLFDPATELPPSDVMDRAIGAAVNATRKQAANLAAVAVRTAAPILLTQADTSRAVDSGEILVAPTPPKRYGGKWADSVQISRGDVALFFTEQEATQVLAELTLSLYLLREQTREESLRASNPTDQKEG
jgi:hypothetical protein